jgi:hypothetical protein
MLVATRVDPTRVGGGQLSLPGVSWYKPTYNVMGPVNSLTPHHKAKYGGGLNIEQ